MEIFQALCKILYCTSDTLSILTFYLENNEGLKPASLDEYMAVSKHLLSWPLRKPSIRYISVMKCKDFMQCFFFSMLQENLSRSIGKALPSLLNSENGYLYLFVYDF